jgi:hypothetical protein
MAFILNDPDEAAYLKAVLQSMRLPYTAEETPDGEKVAWPSRDPAQDKEIQDRLSQYWFIATQCRGTPLPPPDRPAVPRSSC